MNSNVVMILAIFTLGAALLWAVLSWLRAKQAQEHHEDAAAAHHQNPQQNSARTAEVEEAPSGRTWSKERGENPPTPERPDATPPRG